MKTSFVLIILFVISLTFCSESKSQLSFGVKGGMNLSDVSLGNDNFETDMRNGINVYSFAELNLLILAGSAEAGYTQKGFDVPINVTNEFGEPLGKEFFKCKVDYFDISVLGKVRLPGTMVAPYISAGPSIGIKLSSNVSTTNPRLDSLKSFFESITGDFKSTTFGIKFGIGAEITAIPKITLLGEARYNPDLTASYENSGYNIKNKVFEFLVGVKF